MTEYYAVSIGISQGAFGCKASANLLYTHGADETMMTIVWPEMPAQSDPENAGEWLFNCLSDLVANFDAHEVTGAERKPRSVDVVVPRG